MKIKEKEVWLVPFPFTDSNEFKKRPALVLSNARHNNESTTIILCSVTTNPNRKHINLSNNGLSQGKLNEDCYIAYDTCFTMKKELLNKKLFKINDKTFNKVKEGLLEIIF